MNQERFDGLARGLATNRLSRAQVLKSFAAGLFLSFIGALSPRHTRVAAAQPTVPDWCKEVPNPAPRTQPIKPTYRKGNVLEGGCKKFLRRARTGPIGSEGHPVDDNKNAVGVTECVITHTKPTFLKEPYPPSGKPCKPGALCCLKITSEEMRVTFIGQAKVYLLNWKRKGAASSTCKTYESKIESEVKKHEQVHVNDCHAVAKAASTAWKMKGKEFTACGRDPDPAKAEEEARTNLEATIEASLNAFEKNEAKPCVKDIGEKFDKSEPGASICCEGPGGCGCPSGKECCQIGTNPDYPVYGCVNLKTDPKNCGKCRNPCPAGQSCKQGKCVNKRCGGSGGVQCPAGQVCCKGKCVKQGNCVNHCVPAWKPCSSNDQCCQNAPVCCFGYCCPGACGTTQDGVQCCALAGAPAVCEGDPLPGS